jgi:hypothetical protein
MPTRYNQSSPYPTGNAPFAVDLSQQMWNIAQERIKARKQEVEENKLKISESEEFLLKALDFDTVKGMQDKETIELSKLLDEHNSKWALRMKDKSGILSTEDKLEVLRDRREIEDRRNIAATNVGQYEELAKQLIADKDGKIFDHDATHKRMTEFANEGNIGKESAINLAVMKQQPFGQSFMARAEEAAQKELLNPQGWSTIPNGINEDGSTKIIKTNEPIMEPFIESMRSDSDWKDLYNRNPYDAEQLLVSLKKRFIRNPIQPPKTSKTGGKTSAQLIAETEQNEKFGSFNNLALNLMDMDADTINTIKLNKEGEITNISYDQTADGGTEMVFDFQPITTATGRKERLPERIKLPKDQNNTAEMNAFYTKLWNILPADIKKGVDFSDIPKVIKPRQGKYTGRKVAYQNVQNIENAIVLAEKNPSNENIKSLVKTIKENYPNINVKANTPVIGGNSITIYNEDGNGKIYSFKDDIKIKEFRQKIDEKIKTPQQEKLKLTDPAKKVKLKDGTEITAEEFINNLDEKDKEEAIKRINNIP